MSMCDSESTFKSGHGISFPGYLHKSILLSALRQKKSTGKWPVIDSEFSAALEAAFAAPSITDAVQLLAPSIESWRERAFSVDDPVRSEANDALRGAGKGQSIFKVGIFAWLLTKLMTLLLVWQSKKAPVEIVGHELDPVYVWCLKVATELMARDVSPAAFSAFVEEFVANLYGSDSFNVLKLAVDVPQILPAEVDATFLAVDYGQLGRILEEEAALAKAGGSKFGPDAAGALQEQAQILYKIALGRAITRRTSPTLNGVFDLYRARAVNPAGANQLDNARYLASMLGCCGKVEEAKKEFDECVRRSTMPEFASQVTPLWKANLYSNMAELAIEMGDRQTAETYVAKCAVELQTALSKSKSHDQQLGEAICFHAFNLLLLEDVDGADRHFKEATNIFDALQSPFWMEHTSLCLAEITRMRGDVEGADALIDKALPYLTTSFHASESYWIVANRLQARLAVSKNKLAAASDLYKKAADMKYAMMGRQAGTIELFEEYAQCLEKQNLPDEAARVRQQIAAG